MKSENWGRIWPLLLFMSILGWRAFADRAVAALWLLLLCHLATYVLIYVVTPWSVEELLSVSLDRLLLHAVPVAMLLIGYHWSEAGGPRADDVTERAAVQRALAASASKGP